MYGDPLCSGFDYLIVRPFIYMYVKLSPSDCKTLVEEKTVNIGNVVQKIDNISSFWWHDRHCSYFSGEVIENFRYYDTDNELFLEDTKVPLNQGYFVGNYGTFIWV